jgi:hypothetical protein
MQPVGRTLAMPAIKSQFVSIFIFVSIESLNLDISKSWSRQVLKTGLDAKDVLDLDLDWSRLSRPPTLQKLINNFDDIK